MKYRDIKNLNLGLPAVATSEELRIEKIIGQK